MKLEPENKFFFLKVIPRFSFAIELFFYFKEENKLRKYYFL